MMIRFRPATVPAKSFAVPVLASLLLAACAHHAPSGGGESLGRVKGLGTYKVGNPYQINGVWYYPAENPGYDEKGIASWYGPNFHEKYTANGEIFDQNGLSAAHKTLPLPSIVRVTNLENGRSIKVRVNDRGPFVGDRIIDLSRRAAQLLGFDRQGTAKVDVRYVVADSLQAQQIARNNGAPEEIAETPQAVPAGVVVAQSLSGPAAAPVSYKVTQAAPPAPPPETVMARASKSQVEPAVSYPPSSLPPPPPMPSYATIPRETMPPQSVPPQTMPTPSPAQEQTLATELAREPRLPETPRVVPVKPSGIYIQAGAFSVGANAQHMKSMLEGLGPVSISGTTVNGMSVYRVRLGPIATVDQADKLLEQAHRAGAADAKIVVN